MRKFKIRDVTVTGTHVRLTASEHRAPGAASAGMKPARTLTTDISFQEGEPLPEFRRRAQRALRQAAIAEDHASSSRARKFADVLADLSIEVQEPEPIEFTVLGDVIEGILGPRTKHALLTMRDAAGVEHERVITPNRRRRFSVWLNHYTFVSLVGVSDDGLLGDEQRQG